MKRGQSGFTILEMMISLGIVAILSTVVAVSYVNYTENAETADVLTRMSVIREQIEARHIMNQNALATCDDSMFSGIDLDDPYLDLSITSIPLDESDLSKGYGAGVIVSAQADAQGAQGVKMAKVLHDSLIGQNANISGAILTDSVVSYSVLLTNPGERVCDPGSPTQVASAASAQAGGSSAVITNPPVAANVPATAGQPVVTTGPGIAAGTPPGTALQTSMPVPVVVPDAPTQAQQLPTCSSGQELIVTIVNGAPSQVCAKSCASNEMLDSSGTCVATGGAEAMCTAPCADAYGGNCAVEFAGLCGEPFVYGVCEKSLRNLRWS